jgi:hypothetical protein
LGQRGEVIQTRLSQLFRLILLCAVAFALNYSQGVRRCILLFSALDSPYFGRKRPFDLSAVPKLVLMAATLLFVARVTVCLSSKVPVDDRQYSELSEEKPPLRARSAAHGSSDASNG